MTAGPPDFLRVPVERALWIQSGDQQIGVQKDPGQKIIEIVGNAGDEPPHSFELLRFQIFRLECTQPEPFLSAAWDRQCER